MGISSQHLANNQELFLKHQVWSYDKSAREKKLYPKIICFPTENSFACIHKVQKARFEHFLILSKQL